MPTVTLYLINSYLLNHNESDKVNFLHKMNVTVAELPGYI